MLATARTITGRHLVVQWEGDASVRFILSGLFVLHGLVPLLYFGQSRRLFELQPEMVWPDGSWALSRLLADRSTRFLASVACVLAALGFVAAGVSLLLMQGSWRPIVVSVAAFSTVVFVILWNGRLKKLADQGALAVLLNAAILIAVLAVHWPDLDV